MSTKVQRRQRVTNRIEAMRHPVRALALEHLNTHGVASPQEIANSIDEVVGDVAYHVRRLVELGCAELVRTEQVRGAVKHYYCAVEPHAIEFEVFAELPEDVRRSSVVEVLQLQVGDYGTALRDGTLADKDLVAYRLPLDGVDEEGLVEIREIQERAFRELQEIPGRCHERPKDSDDRGARVSVWLNAFQVSSF
jgi:hypothetical protein